MKTQIHKLKNLKTIFMSKTTIKQISIMLFFGLAVLATSCKKDKSIIKDGDTGKTGTFTVDGVSYTGKTSVQTFVNDNYSIVCQSDEPLMFVQVTFRNKAEAEAGGVFDIEDADSYNIPSGSVQLGTSKFFNGDPTSSKTISVSSKKITINNVTIKSSVGSTTTTINSANIKF